MKIEGNKTHMLLIPENDYDCFQMGHISTVLDNSLKMTATPGNNDQKINSMQIPLQKIYEFILKNTRKVWQNKDG